jgi:hypothetical protein
MMRHRKTAEHGDHLNSLPPKWQSKQGESTRWKNRLLLARILILIPWVMMVRRKILLYYSKQQAKEAKPHAPTRQRRFPRYGTDAFAQECSWTLRPPTQNCIMMVRPKTNGNEGLADWVSQVVTGFISSQLHGCNFIMDYGVGIEMSQILIPHTQEEGDYHYNWTVPSGFKCLKANHCENSTTTAKMNSAMLQSEKEPEKVLLPSYRHAYKNIPTLSIYRQNFRPLERALPGFILDTGMACALERLCELSPAASIYQPDLFSRILPTLRSIDDEKANTLVLSLYYRTGRTDVVARQEELGKELEREKKKGEGSFRRYMDCVLKTETRLLKEKNDKKKDGPFYSNIVWLVVSDSPYFKQWATDEYTSHNVTATNGKTSSLLFPGIPREIITTTAKGAHTRTRRGPSTADFAEGIIDWYLLGESDLLFTNGDGGYTFGTTAAQRTNRSVINCNKCEEMFYIHEGNPPTPESYRKQRDAQRDAQEKEVQRQIMAEQKKRKRNRKK